MTPMIVPRDLVARELAVSTNLLVRYEACGLVHSVREGKVEGYEPAQISRIWRIVSFHRDLGVNLAGVEVILRLFDHLAEVHHRVDHIADELRALLDDDESPSAPESNE
jgi:MerR family transcriptional regulator, heat shock protein HspR